MGLDHTLNVCQIAGYIERHIKEKIDYRQMEKSIGYSYHHIRGFFKGVTGISLARYIVHRQVAGAAFEIRHSGKRITEIAEDFAFGSVDTFTRCFVRAVGVTPSAFKKSAAACGRQVICPSVYGPVIVGHPSPMFTLQHIKEVNVMSEMKKLADSCVLYGVPQLTRGKHRTLPFPLCLQVVLNYMGQDMDYTRLLAYSGEAFRLRWEACGWSPAAIDPRYIYREPLEAYARAFGGAGRKYVMSVDTGDKKAIVKAEAIALIKEELDCGRPVIALGVVGPPEACVITGYEDHGEVVLGWSLFQPSGEEYFVKAEWWQDTQEIHTYDGSYLVYGGQKAYEAWAQALEAEDFDMAGAQMGHGDALRMAGEGRTHAAGFIDALVAEYPQCGEALEACAIAFRAVVACMDEIVGLSIEDTPARAQMAALVRKAAQYEKTATDQLATAVASMGEK